MSEFSLAAYSDVLDRQVVHMDQGVIYAPEYRVTRSMRDYPSRKLQLARAVYHGELEASATVGETLLHSMLSRQGERWQNFGENPEEYTDCLILARAMMLEKGVGLQVAEELQGVLKANGGHVLDVASALDKWQDAFRDVYGIAEANTDAAGQGTVVLLDDATCLYAQSSARVVAGFLKKAGISEIPQVMAVYDGWEYFVYGLVQEGIRHGHEVREQLRRASARRVITLSGRSEYVLRVLYPKLGIGALAGCVGILGLMDSPPSLHVDKRSYLYAGSFFSRYLVKSAVINSLVTNAHEVPNPASEEGEPLVMGDRRMNVVTQRQRPICAEHLLLGYPEASRLAIREDALAYISISGAEQVVCFDPWAFAELQQTGVTDMSVRLFLDLLA